MRATFQIPLLVLALWGNTAAGQFLAAELRSLWPTGGQVGQSLDVQVGSGANLDEVTSLWFSHPGITAELKTLDPLPLSPDRQPQYGQFTVTLSPDVPPGRYELRTIGRHGISNPRAFLATSLACEKPPAISHDPAMPTRLAVDGIVHGRATAAEIDYFGIAIDVPRAVTIELLAQEIDSRMIGQLRLYDSSGRVVAAARGGDEVDPSITLEPLPAGQYLLAVHDFTFRGGDEYAYQLVARDPAGATAPLRGGDTLPGQLPAVWLTRAFSVEPRTPLGVAAAGPQAGKAALPLEATDWFPTDRDDVEWLFSASQGETYAMELASQRLGQPTDARMIVQRIEPQPSGPPKLHDVLNVDDGPNLSDGALNLLSKDPLALFQAPAAADYRVAIRDLDRGVSLAPRQAYRLSIRPPNPGFSLVAYRLFPHSDINQTQPLGSKLFRGGAELIRVVAHRLDGWNGAIKIAAEGLPAGITAGEAIIAANQNHTQLTLSAAEDAAATTAPIRLVGRSEDNQLVAEAAAAVITWGKGGGRDFIRSRLASNLMLGVSAQDVAPISARLGDGSVPEVKKGQSISLPIGLVRREGGQAACVLRPRDLPPGVTVGEVTIPADRSEASCEIKAAAGAAAGTYSLWLQLETKIKLKPNPQALERAQQYRTHLQNLHDDPAQAGNLESIKSAISEADKRIEAAKAAAKEQELTVFLPTSNATFRVVDP
jgi:hypothetical protein